LNISRLVQDGAGSAEGPEGRRRPLSRIRTSRAYPG